MKTFLAKVLGKWCQKCKLNRIKEKNNINYDFRQNKNENIFPNNSEVQKNVENVSIFSQKKSKITLNFKILKQSELLLVSF